MKLLLNTWQRLMLTRIISEIRGPISLIARAAKALEIVEMTEKELKSIGFTALPGGGGVKWVEPEGFWKVEFGSERVAGVVRQAMQAFAGWPTTNYADVVDLHTQAGIELDLD